MKLISKEELRYRMYHEAFEADSEMVKWESGCWIRYKLFEKVLDEIPTIESRPKGKWITTERGYVCTNCTEDNWEDKNYCPNCGADMREEEECLTKK